MPKTRLLAWQFERNKPGVQSPWQVPIPKTWARKGERHEPPLTIPLT